MVFPRIKLNDGTEIPSIAYGTGSVWKGKDVVKYVDQALEAGFSHIDTAAYYANESSIGAAIRESGLQRKDLYITTKYDGGVFREAIEDSLSKLGLKSVDLYLIHNPRLANGDFAGAWAQLEAIREDGLAKSIGVSNFEVKDLQEIVKVGKVKPVVNQIRFHPYNYAQYADLLEYSAPLGIVTEAYGSLAPITTFPDGPLTPVLEKIAKRLSISSDTENKGALQATPAQVIFKWVQSKGAVIVTTSGKRERLEEYLQVVELSDLTQDEIAEIEEKGAEGAAAFRRIEWLDGLKVRAESVEGRICSADMRKRVMLCILAALVLLFVMYVRSGPRLEFDASFFEGKKFGRFGCKGMRMRESVEVPALD